MSGWRDVLAAYLTCRQHGHQWGERRYWGDAQRDLGGTHRCQRLGCGKVGTPPADVEQETP